MSILVTFREVLANILDMPTTAWIYLPKDKNWSLNSNVAVLESEEIPPDMEDAPDAGVPEFAKKHGLIQAVPVTALQDIVGNARMQKGGSTDEDLFKAFLFYYNHDAFINLTRQ